MPVSTSLPARSEIAERLADLEPLAVHRAQKPLRALEGERARRESTRASIAASRRRSAPPDPRGAASPSIPKFSFRPAADDAAIASAWAARGPSSPSNRDTAAAAPIGAQRRRAVPAALVVARVHRLAKTRLDLEADHVRVEQRRDRTRPTPPPPRARPRRVAHSDGPATRSTCRRSRARAPPCRSRARRCPSWRGPPCR